MVGHEVCCCTDCRHIFGWVRRWVAVAMTTNGPPAQRVLKSPRIMTFAPLIDTLVCSDETHPPCRCRLRLRGAPVCGVAPGQHRCCQTPAPQVRLFHRPLPRPVP